MIVHTPADLKRAVKQKKLGVMMGLEGGHMIEDSPLYLQQLFDRGVLPRGAVVATVLCDSGLKYGA